MSAHYATGIEAGRLDQAHGQVEFLRTAEILQRALPEAPAVIADIGGGPGRYARWLAELGYTVEHRDVTPLHVDQARALGVRGMRAAVADARQLDLPGGSVDALLLLGPLYHLPERADRLSALREAARVVRPGGAVFAAAISRWAPRLHGLLVQRLDRQVPRFIRDVDEAERTGLLLPLEDGAFSGWTHRPDELADEAADAGLVVEDLVGVEGLSFALDGLAERLADPAGREVVLSSARALERVPELMGLSPHLVVTARRT
jgi:SAM-dependent methyltransferase